MILTRRFYMVLTLIILLMGSGYAFAPLFTIGQGVLFLLLLSVLADGYMLYRIRGIRAFRQCSARFSNGDENAVNLRVESCYPYPVFAEVIDEVPFIFQQRNISFRVQLQANEGKQICYHLRPTSRGIYGFGQIRVFVTGRIGLLSRRYTCGEEQDIKVYPSYLMLHRYELLAMSDNLTELGIKRIRRVGHHTEFEQIKEYVKGDDYRTINWKASARRHELMVNVYQDERSQQIYSVIDKGRVMQQAVRGADAPGPDAGGHRRLQARISAGMQQCGSMHQTERIKTWITKPISPKCPILWRPYLMRYICCSTS